MENEIVQLRAEIRQVRIINRMMMLGLALLVIFSFSSRMEERLRVKELIIEDENGKPFIMMGSPVSNTTERKRNDSLRGIVFLDHTGTDRLFLGKDGKLQMGGQLVDRGSPGWSFMINDTLGDERGGFGFADEEDRIGLGLDYGGKDGLEAIYLSASEDLAYLTINANVKKGVHDRIVLWHDGKEDLSLLKIGDSKKDDRILFKASKGRPELFYRDSSHRKKTLGK